MENIKGNIPPIKFTPIFKSPIWGGRQIMPFKGMPSDGKSIGESWEVSGVEGNESVVSGGEFDGTPLPALIAQLGARLVGKQIHAHFGNTFPILVKFIDAAGDLSIQVHPNDEMAKRYGHPNGKTEMWYVVSAEPGAQIICGFDKELSAEEYKAAVESDTILQKLRSHESHAGDCFFIPAGRVHSIGAGNFIVEIQQTCDLTYRIYDFNRRDANGNLRELHTALAAEAIDYKVEKNYRTLYTPAPDTPVTLAHCREFTTRLHELTRPATLDYTGVDSFIIYIVFSGSCTLTDQWGNLSELRCGESVLIPAETSKVSIRPGTEGVKFLETHM